MIFKNNKSYLLFVILFLCIGFIVRLLYLGDIPGNGAVQYDEAYGGYEAWSMLHYGHDSRGYKNFPVYLKTWGAGMSLLPNVAMMPFIKILDLTPLAIRLPQAILGCFSLLIFYLLVSKIRGKEVGLIALFLLSICPWHIMMSRFGLDCNFFPGFLLLSIYLLVKSLDKKVYFYLSMVCWGLTFYTYAAPWVIMPFLILHLFFYIRCRNNFRIIYENLINKNSLLFFTCLLVFFIPIICLYLVNTGRIPEFSNTFFSVPTLSQMRYEDVNFSSSIFFERVKKIIDLLLFSGRDYFYWWSEDYPKWEIGIYYNFSGAFIIIGVLTQLLEIFKVKNIYQHSKIFLIWFFWALVLSLLIEINVHRINIIYIPAIYFIAEGIYQCARLFKYFMANIIKFIIRISGSYSLNAINVIYNVNYRKIFLSFIIVIYLGAFFNFSKYYFTDYSQAFYERFFGDMPKVLKKINDISRGKNNVFIHTNSWYFAYPNILFHLKYPTDEYVKSVKFYDVKFHVQPIISFANFKFSDDPCSDYNKDDIYILEKGNNKHLEFIKNNNLKVEELGRYILAY